MSPVMKGLVGGAFVYAMGSAHTIDIGGLGTGQRLVVDQPICLEPFEDIRFPQPARVRLEIRGGAGRLEIEGGIEVVAVGECHRCLEVVERPMRVAVEEQLEVAGAAQADPFGPSNVLSGDRLDLRDLTTQLVCSAMPMGFLCAESCRGLCAVCGENNNTGACTCANGSN